MYNLRVLYKFNGHFGSSIRFSERTEHFPEHPDNCFKYLAKLNLKLLILSLCFREKDKIKETKQKDEKLIYDFLGRNFLVDPETAIRRCFRE